VLLKILEQKLTFKPTHQEYGGLGPFSAQRFRFGHEFGLDLDGAFVDRGSSSVVLFVHGNKHNLTRFSDHYALFAELGLSFLTFDYPGYGQSVGTPSEQGMYAAARAALAHLRHAVGCPESEIIVYGCSMGGAVAIELLQSERVKALVTESTFTNSWEMARHLYPLLPFWRLLPKRFANDERIRSLKLPLFMLHGDADRVVPVTMAHQLFSLAPAGTQLEIVQGANHVNSVAVGGAALRNSLSLFLKC
jgi:fermentation-respiration switch protein FrsA (DUF1100 family)